MIAAHRNPLKPIETHRTHRNPSKPIETHRNPSKPIETHRNPSKPIETLTKKIGASQKGSSEKFRSNDQLK